MKYGIFPTTFAEHYDALNQLAQKYSINQMQQILILLSDHELGFLKTTAQHVFLEMMLLRLATRNGVIDSDSGNSNSSLQAAPGALEEEDLLDDEDCDSDDEYEDDEDDDLEDEEDACSVYWSHFITAIEQLQEPLLLSIFSQSNVEKWHQSSNELHISVPKELSFFHQTLEEYKPTWTQCLKNSFKCNELRVTLAYNKSMAQDPVVTTYIKEQQPIESAVQTKKAISNHSTLRSFTQPSNNNQPRVNQKHTAYRNNHYNKTTAGSIVDVSDAALWPKAHLISQFFPGTVVEYRG
jgi:DNA polymerase III gamma/tau subunit